MTHPHWWWRDLFPEDTGPDVSMVQVKLGADDTGHVNADTLSRIRGFQRSVGLEVTGVVDLTTADALGESATYGLVPQWYQASLIDEAGLRAALHLSPRADLSDGIKRYQSAHHHYPTGEMDQALAIEIGE